MENTEKIMIWMWMSKKICNNKKKLWGKNYDNIDDDNQVNEEN